MSATPCPRCGNCNAIPDAHAFELLLAALSNDDLDGAIEAGLLSWPGCTVCNVDAGLDPDAIILLMTARDARLAALAARERHRIRQVRLQHRPETAAARRSSPQEAVAISTALPSAAAAALARAKARAAGPKSE